MGHAETLAVLFFVHAFQALGGAICAALGTGCAIMWREELQKNTGAAQQKGTVLLLFLLFFYWAAFMLLRAGEF